MEHESDSEESLAGFILTEEHRNMSGPVSIGAQPSNLKFEVFSRLYSWAFPAKDTELQPVEKTARTTLEELVTREPSEQSDQPSSTIGADCSPHLNRETINMIETEKVAVSENEAGRIGDLTESMDKRSFASTPSDPIPEIDIQKSSSSSGADDWDLISIQPGSAELSVEAALLWCLNPAIHGIRSIGVLPALERARRLVEMCNGDTTAAVVMAAGGEAGGAKRTRIIFEFLLRQVPLVGCPAYLLTSTWTHLRAVSTIAAIYGHDLDQARTQHEILWCLLPNNPESSGSTESIQDTGPVSVTAKAVSQILISTAIKKTTGITMVSELFQLGADLWSVSRKNTEDDFEHLSLGPSATARHYFCPDSQFSSHRFFLTVLGVILPWLFRLPSIISTSMIIVAAVLFMSRRQIVDLIPQEWYYRTPVAVAYGVFTTHALLPIVGISNGFSLILSSTRDTSTADRISLLVLGTMAVTAGFRAGSIKPDMMHIFHVQTRKVAILIALSVHVLPILDRTGIYVERIGWLLGDTVLCSSARSLHYLSVIVSSTTQQMLISQLKRRDVILRLLGAERIMILSMALFFRGITAAISNESLLNFFRQITPVPVFCCIVMVLRQHALAAGVILTITPLLPVYLNHSGIVLGAGLLIGALCVGTIWNDYTMNESAYTSPIRLLYILPGVVSGKTREVMDSMLKASGRKALKTVLTSMARNLSNRIFYRKIE